MRIIPCSRWLWAISASAIVVRNVCAIPVMLAPASAANEVAEGKDFALYTSPIGVPEDDQLVVRDLDIADIWESIKSGSAAKHVEQLIQDAIASGEDAVAEQIHEIHVTALAVASGISRIADDVRTASAAYSAGNQTASASIEQATKTLVELLEEQFPPPSQAAGHEERKAEVAAFLSQVENTLVGWMETMGPSDSHSVATHGMGGVNHIVDAVDLKAHLDNIRPHIENLLVLIGDLNEQHPHIATALAAATITVVLWEVKLLRPVLDLAGFGQKGPVKGTLAAWTQRMVFGGAVPKGSWFSVLQRLGMTLVRREILILALD
ncbi:hypothetical protein WOLCODRAFT_157043 [Wolfiporia cocos MD-104 SS10]|uniref:Secreted protein n=1 Tax=Wolfiporia cocos (strain MD-104) TaxID=742152 RepID=A0A2H3JF61_WOLCO|nr:hypothetical protein WOLCODRAFT_157043 [Wolfiporia cocos MD-104 SS10]